MNDMNERFSSVFTFENLKEALVSVTQKGQMHLGTDGLNKQAFIKQKYSRLFDICERLGKGNYLFTPVREVRIPKGEYTENMIKEMNKAEQEKNTRPLSIFTINDTIVMKALYLWLEPFYNQKFEILKENVYSYIKSKSVKDAVYKIQELFKEGYVYGFDGDIQSFFDSITHDKLLVKIQCFFGDNPLILKMLYRYINVGRALDRDNEQNGKFDIQNYYRKKPKVIKRENGIPQGGILSGMLANIYLLDFDKYIVNELNKQHDIKYVRYADDFLILCKDKSLVNTLYEKARKFLAQEDLLLHNLALPEMKPEERAKCKTKFVDLPVDKNIEFLGFKINEIMLSIRESNIKRFKNKINEIFDKYKSSTAVKELIWELNLKICGIGIRDDIDKVCTKCNKKIFYPSWGSFFSCVTDSRIFKQMDLWIKKKFSLYLKKNLSHLKPESFYYRGKVDALNYDIANHKIYSLFSLYIYYKKILKRQNEYCHCASIRDPLIPSY